MAKLVLVRHGESKWNKLGLWQGWTDIDLTENGIEQAKAVGKEIKDIKFDFAYSSPLIRASKTLEEALKVIGQSDLHITHDKALTESITAFMPVRISGRLRKRLGKKNFRNLEEPGITQRRKGNL